MRNLAQPLLSIVTVTKNCVGSLDKTLSSVSAIKTIGIEYIIVDGASTDGTVELIKDCGNLVDKFISEPDLGIYNAMNKSIDMASGRYIIFINGDDVILPEGFSVAYEVLKESKNEVIAAVTTAVSVDGQAIGLAARPWHLYFFNSVPHPSTFVSATTLRKYRFREDFRIAADYDLFLRLFLDGKKFHRIDPIIALHDRGGTSSDSSLSMREMDQIRRENLGFFRYTLTNYIWAIYRYLKSFCKSMQR